jgi:hypothetical protein
MAITKARRRFMGSVDIDTDLTVGGDVTVTDDFSADDVTAAGEVYIKTLPVCQPRGNTDVDTGTEVVDSFADTTFHDDSGGYGFVRWQYLIRKGTDMRSGYVYALWDTADNVDYYERSDATLGTCTDVQLNLSVDISAGLVRLLATAATDDWRFTW